MKLSSDKTLLEVKRLCKYFPVRKGVLRRTVGYVKAVDNVDMAVNKGETLGLVGESGCGKTTTGRTILHLTRPTRGTVLFRSKILADPNEACRVVDVATAEPKTLKALRREMQIIFQDPSDSLNPRMTVGVIVSEPMLVHGTASGSKRDDRVGDLLAAVGLKPDHMRRYPHEFSGGQRQRVGIARALALDPQLIVADEPVSALDVSIQAQVLNLLEDLQAKFDLTYLFISHDLCVVKHTSTRVAVMYLGKIVESAETDELFINPKHPYTEALMSAVPVPDPDYEVNQIVLQGDVPSPMTPPSGCSFHPRCNYARDICRKDPPQCRELWSRHLVSCHFAETLTLKPVDLF